MENSQTNQDHLPKVIEVEMKDGEDFPSLFDHSSLFMNNKIVLFGGENSNNKMNNIFHIFNLKTNKWSSKELKGESDQIPNPRIYHTTNVIGNNIYIIGGWLGNGGDKNVYKIEFDTQKCQIFGELKEPVVLHSADVHNQIIYILCGQNMKTYQYTSMFQKFNLQTSECEVIKPVGFRPVGRCAHQSVIIQDNMYIFGGFTGKTYLQDMFSINLSSNEFTEIEQNGLIPTPRCTFSFFAFEDQLFLFSGNSKKDYYQDFYAFDLRSSSWKTQEIQNEKCLLKRAYHSTVAVKEGSRKIKIYLVGGKKSNRSFQKNMNVITITNNKIFWVLHYLESTGIHYLPGYCLIQEIIELFE